MQPGDAVMHVKRNYLVAGAALCSFLISNSALGQKFPSCVTDEAQAKTKIVVREWYQSLMKQSMQENGNIINSRIIDLEIDIPYAKDAYVGKYAGVVKCIVTGFVTIKRDDGVVGKLPLKVMVYYSYDQDGNFTVDAQPLDYKN